MKTFKFLFAILAFALLSSGCVYNFIVPEDVAPPVDPGDPDAPQISFSTQIVPIFNDNNNCTSCHGAGGRAPVLTTENAYASINPKYINSATPEESKIYAYPHPDTNTHKQKKYTANQANLILGWISQGAKDN